MFKRKTEGSVICTSCGVLVGVNDSTCYNCGRRNPGLWGFGPALRSLGNDLGFVPIVTGGTIILYVLSLILSRDGIQVMLSPSTAILYLLGASGATPVVGYGRWWTLLTAAWLHGGVLHIFFNVMWIRSLAPEIAVTVTPGSTPPCASFTSPLILPVELAPPPCADADDARARVASKAQMMLLQRFML